MTTNPRRIAALLASAATATTGLVLAAPAALAADATTTHITSHSGAQFTQYNDDSESPAIEFKGTSDGDTAARFDLRCYYSATDYQTLAANQTFQTGGAIDVIVPSYRFEEETCVVRAIPQTGMTSNSPTDFSAFTGLLVAGGEVSSYHYSDSTVSGGRNYDYYVESSQLSGDVGYDSASDCGIEFGYLIDSSGAPAGNTASGSNDFGCNGYFYTDNTVGTTNLRGGLQVDGIEAYAADSVESINASADVPGLTYSVAHDPATGNMVIAESEPLLTCPDHTFPPTSATCTTFTGTGVRLDRVISQGSAGRVIAVRDTFVSTDGRAHALSAQYENDMSSSSTGYQAPGQTTFAQHTNGDTIPVTTAGPGTLETINDPTQAASLDNPVTSLTWSSAPSSLLFYGSRGYYATYAKNVPAGGSAVLTQTYSHGASQAEVGGYAQGATAGYANAIKVALGALPAVSGTKALTVKGTFSGGANGLPTTATVAVGAASVTVPVATDGTFTAPVTLTPGANTIAVLGSDDGVLKASTSAVVTYADPVTGSGSKVTKTTKSTTKTVNGKKVTTKKVTKVTVSLTLSCAFYGPAGGCPVKVSDTPKGYKALTKSVIVPLGGKVTVTLTAASSTVKKVAGLKKGKHLDSALTATYTDPAGGTFTVTSKTLRLA